jgi:mRNA interferase YafQ
MYFQRLRADIQLPSNLKDHALTGNWKGCRECHIKPNLLLIYMKTDEIENSNGTLRLVRLGSHTELLN